MRPLNELEEDRKVALPEVRESMAEQVALAYIQHGLSKDDIKSAEGIIRLLLEDPSLRVRKVLANHLKHCYYVPQDIILKLCADVDEVALPILAETTVLEDDHLIAMVKKSKSIARLCTIARREALSTALSDALIRSHQVQVVLAVLRNKSARIGTVSFQGILDYAYKTREILAAMVDRGDLPSEIVERMLELVTGELQEQLLSVRENQYRSRDGVRLWERLDEAPKMRQVANKAAMISEFLPSDRSVGMGKIAMGHSGNMVELAIQKSNVLLQEIKRVKLLSEKNTLSSSLVLEALCEGNIAFFEVGLSKLAHAPIVSIYTLMKEGQLSALQSLCKQAGFPTAISSAIFIVLGYAVEKGIYHPSLTQVDFKKGLVEYIVTKGYDRTVPMMAYLMALLGNKLKSPQEGSATLKYASTVA